MQPPPTAADLLAVVAEVLTDEVVPALSGPAQHHARVAASLVGIVEREWRLGADQAVAERAALTELLGAADTDASLLELRERLAGALRSGLADTDEADRRVWTTLMDAVRGDLAIAKPGHDVWEGD